MKVYKVKNGNKIESSSIYDRNELLSDISVSYTHLTLPTT